MTGQWTFLKAPTGSSFSAPTLTALALTGVGTITGGRLDFVATADSDAIRFYRWNPPVGWELGAKITQQGSYQTNAWVTISGHGNAMTPPSADAFMLGVYSDVASAAVQVRGNAQPGSYVFSGMNGAGAYTFSIEESGQLQWGASTRAAMDTTLARTAVGVLTTIGVFAATVVRTLTALIGLGGGAAATLGTSGGAGPTVAAQNGWLSMQDSTGATVFVPVWK